jgi:hypothetical protein
MAWSYLSSEPGSSDRSWIRLKIGDNSSATPELQDEEIDMLLSDEGSKERAAIAAARALSAVYARKVDKTVGRLRIAASQAAQAYERLANSLEKQLNMRVGGESGIYAGGISVSDKRSNELDSDVVQPGSRIKEFDHPGRDANLDTEYDYYD